MKAFTNYQLTDLKSFLTPLRHSQSSQYSFQLETSCGGQQAPPSQLHFSLLFPSSHHASVAQLGNSHPLGGGVGDGGGGVGPGGPEERQKLEPKLLYNSAKSALEQQDHLSIGS